MSCGCEKKNHKPSKPTSVVHSRYNLYSERQGSTATKYEVSIGSCNACKQAVKVCIPHYTVETKEEARQYKNAFVDVISDSSLYWIDSDGIASMTYRRIKYEDDHEAADGKYSDQRVIDQANSKIYFYMPDGSVYHINLERSV